MSNQAILAAGCFWGIEKAFLDTPGVLDVESGYTGGHTEHPTYEQVCTDTTGHAEAVRVTFDPAQISYEQLLERFFEVHDPTQVNRQGPDVGSQYRSAIFYLDKEQYEIAQRARDRIAATYVPRNVATEITAASTFWRAEEYHQRYFDKHPEAVCHI